MLFSYFYVCNTRWTLEDDKTLYEGFKVGKNLEDLCVTLKRGYQGCKARLNHLNNPNHKAYMRYFGSKKEGKNSEIFFHIFIICYEPTMPIIINLGLILFQFSGF